VEDNNFEPLVKKIIDSNESYFITGAAGCGKSALINMLKKNIRENIETYDEEEVVVKKETRAITNIKKCYCMQTV
jgi:predicted AAA+ superfamily ATPase